jgi:hypothetical protein
VSGEAVPGSGGGSSAQLSKKDARDLNSGSTPQVIEQEAPGPNSASGPQARKEDTQDSKPGLAAQVIGNASLVTAALVYMGWAYEAALLGYFHISALSFNLSVLQYVLKSTPFFFHPAIILGAVMVVIIIVVVGPILGRLIRLPRNSGISRILRSDLAMGLGLLIVAGLVWFGLRHNGLGSWFSSHPGFFYIAVALIGVGSLLLTWPSRARHGLFSFALAIVIAAVCTLWIAGLYASSLGTTAAEAFASSLTTKTAVTVYSIETLALSGPGVTCQSLPAGSLYHYRYEGLRLLYVDSGTYYLLPVNWASQQDPTYVFSDSDQIRIELSGGDVAFGTGRMGCASGLLHRSRHRNRPGLDLSREHLIAYEREATHGADALIAGCQFRGAARA